MNAMVYFNIALRRFMKNFLAVFVLACTTGTAYSQNQPNTGQKVNGSETSMYQDVGDYLETMATIALRNGPFQVRMAWLKVEYFHGETSLGGDSDTEWLMENEVAILLCEPYEPVSWAAYGDNIDVVITWGMGPALGEGQIGQVTLTYSRDG